MAVDCEEGRSYLVARAGGCQVGEVGGGGRAGRNGEEGEWRGTLVNRGFMWA